MPLRAAADRRAFGALGATPKGPRALPDVRRGRHDTLKCTLPPATGVPLAELEVERFSLPMTSYATWYFLPARVVAGDDREQVGRVAVKRRRRGNSSPQLKTTTPPEQAVTLAEH